MIKFNYFYKIMMNPVVYLAASIWLVVCYIIIDQPLAEWLHTFELEKNFALLATITLLGSNLIYIVMFFAIALFFRYLRPNKIWENHFWFLWLAVLLSAGVTFVLKCLLGRARPQLWFDSKMYGFYWMKLHAPFWSFPSGHTTAIMAVMYGLCFIFPRYWLGFISTGALIAASRILLVKHYLSDVIGAAFLTFLVVSALVYFLQHKKKWAIALPIKL